jgi:hypothetical protein
MWETIKLYASRVWKFLRELLRSSLELFKKELKSKQKTLKDLTPQQAYKVVKDEGIRFFVAGSKAFAERYLYTKTPNLVAFSEACVLPYGESFQKSGQVNLLSCISTFSRRAFNAIFNEARYSFLRDIKFEFDAHKVTGLFR